MSFPPCIRVFLLCVLGTSAWAQPASFGVKDFLATQKAIWTSPFRLEERQVPWLLLFGGVTGALIASDRHLNEALPNTPAQLRWGGRISRLGGGGAMLGASAGIWAWGSAHKQERVRRAGMASLSGTMHALALTYGWKLAMGRERPRTGSGNGHFWSNYESGWKGDQSFPSGHSMASWTVASVLSHEYAEKRYVPLLAYGFAAAISGSRVAAQKHFVSDVLVGAGSGYLLGRLVQKRYATAATGGASKHGWWRPTITPEWEPAGRRAALRLSWAGR